MQNDVYAMYMGIGGIYAFFGGGMLSKQIFVFINLGLSHLHNMASA